MVFIGAHYPTEGTSPQPLAVKAMGGYLSANGGECQSNPHMNTKTPKFSRRKLHSKKLISVIHFSVHSFYVVHKLKHIKTEPKASKYNDLVFVLAYSNLLKICMRLAIFDEHCQPVHVVFNGTMTMVI